MSNAHAHLAKAGAAERRHLLIQGDATRLPLADQSVDLVFTSPPYIDARTYGIGAQRDCVEWVEWMLTVVTELTRVCRGLVLINCAGVTRDRVYRPGPEGLAWEWYKRGGNLWRPCYWHRVGIPGSGGKQWLRADIEYVWPFKRDREWLAWADNVANGHPPKWGPGGEMSHRVSSGKRCNQWGPVGGPGGMGMRRANGTIGDRERPSHVLVEPKPMYRRGRDGSRQNGCDGVRKAMLAAGELPDGASVSMRHAFKREHTKSRADGTDEVQVYIPPVKANPGNLVKTIVGGGALGHPLAHENEAPFPVALAEWFIKSWCPPGGIVLDCFSGSGTTVDAANRLGRRGIGLDLRMSQCELARRRLATPHARKTRKPPVGPRVPTLFGDCEAAA